MALFIKLMKLHPGMKILDLGGYPDFWNDVDLPLDITCLNLPGSGITERNYKSHHHITCIEGDACSMPYLKPGDFDVIFSNSVIEHVGNEQKRSDFASEVLRLSDKYWIQTPSKYFPIEAHCGMPFWWFYPTSFRSFILKRWKKKLPAWTEMVANTSIVNRSELKKIFPNCQIQNELFFIIPKSLIAFSLGK